MRPIAPALVLFSSLLVWSQQTALTPEHTLQVRQISDLRFSPDGRRLVFTVSEPVKGTTRNTHLWMLDVSTREVRQFTYSAKSERSPRWSPDGRQVAFLSNREEGNSVYVIPTDHGEAVKLPKSKHEVQSFEWSPDGKRIAFVAGELKTESDEKKEKEKDDARVVDKSARPSRLWLLTVATAEVRQLTKAPWRVRGIQWTPQGDRIVVSATDKPASDQWVDRIYTVAVNTGEMKEVAAPSGPFGDVKISSDGLQVAYKAARLDGPTPHDLFLQPLAGGTAANLTGTSLDRPIGEYTWNADGSIVAVVDFGVRNRFYRLPASGAPTTLPEMEINPGTFAVNRQGTIAFVGGNATRWAELYLVGSAGPPRAVSRFHEGLASVALVKPEFLRYKSFDGTEIEGALFTPANRTAGTRLPLVALIHGGPTGRWADGFNAWAQLLAARGFAVFAPNIRGSVGYGHKFVEANRADWGGGDFKDVMAGVDFLIARGVADPARLGIGGWSYGGYMAAWAITQTNRFKASVVGAGMSDLAAEFGTEDGSAYDEWFFGTPYEKLAGFQKSSPITYIKNARTPTLILHGEADATDPIGQGQQLYRGLKRYGVETDFVIYPREPHGLREEKHVVDMLNRMVAWFSVYLKP